MTTTPPVFDATPEELQGLQTTSDEINVGLNGIGRIGKCLLMQMTKDPKFRIRAINCSSLKADQYADYLRYDSSHKFAVRMGLRKIEVLSETRIRIVTFVPPESAGSGALCVSQPAAAVPGGGLGRASPGTGSRRLAALLQHFE